MKNSIFCFMGGVAVGLGVANVIDGIKMRDAASLITGLVCMVVGLCVLAAYAEVPA